MEAVVISIEEGKHGTYVVSKIKEGPLKEESVTFSPDAWKEEGPLPEPGSIVLLNNLVLKVAGMRARNVHYAPVSKGGDSG